MERGVDEGRMGVERVAEGWTGGGFRIREGKRQVKWRG